MRSIRSSFAVLSLIAISAVSAQAQVGVFGTAGVTLPMGDFGDNAKAGWIASGGLRIPLGTTSMSITAEGLYGGNKLDAAIAGVSSGDKIALYGGLGGLVYRFGDMTKPGIFVVGNVGMLVQSYKSGLSSSYDNSDNGIAFGGGVGVSVPRGNMAFVSTVRYLTASIKNDLDVTSTLSFVAIQAGVRFTLGGSK